MNLLSFVVLYASVCLLISPGTQAEESSGRALLKERKSCKFYNGRFIDPKCPERLANEKLKPPRAPEPATPPPRDPSPPPPPAPGGVDLEKCALDGELQAPIVAEKVCVELLSICAPEPALKATAKIASQQEEILKEILERACRLKAVETCKSKTFGAAERVDPKCHNILVNGPNVEALEDDFLCDSVIAASTLFALQADRLCEEAFPEEEKKEDEKKKDEKKEGEKVKDKKEEGEKVKDEKKEGEKVAEEEEKTGA
ncbi:hypothetical protein BSKO_11888 [Bryopsis sp. KO-2023]|nr:hypothetical protein BSKO_11888 [Bryopsis sp. KO-2023]